MSTIFSGSNPSNAKPARPWLVGALLAAVTLAVFWPATGFQFINMDDNTFYVTTNVHVLRGLSWENLVWAFDGINAGFWHPLTWLSLQADATLWGTEPLGFHRTNVVLHALNGVLVFMLIRQITGSLWRSALVAALFALHPLRVEPVAWISERKELLGAFFGLLSLFFYARHAGQNLACEAQTKGRVSIFSFFNSSEYRLALFWFACGLMSKTMVVTLPAVMLLLDWWPLKRVQGFGFQPAHRRLLAEKIPFLLLGVVAAWLTMKGNFHASGAGDGMVALEQHPLMLRMENALVSYLRYLGELFWPFNLAPLYPYPKAYSGAAVAGAAAALGIISIAAWRARGRFWAVGWLWYLVMLLPVIGLLQVGPHSHADRYVYLPLIGIFMALVWGAAEWATRIRAVKFCFIGLVFLVLTACVARTRDQLFHWQDSGNLFAHTAAVTKENYIAEALLGNYLADHGEPAKAAASFQRAVTWRPDYADAWNGLGLAHSALGQKTDAAADFHRALAADSGHVGAWNNLGLLLAAEGQTNEAIKCYQRAVEINPDEPVALNNLGQALAAQGKFSEAISFCERAVQARPDEAGFQVNLAAALGNAGRLPEAVLHYRKALQLNPNLAEVREFLRAVDAAPAANR